MPTRKSRRPYSAKPVVNMERGVVDVVSNQEAFVAQCLESFGKKDKPKKKTKRNQRLSSTLRLDSPYAMLDEQNKPTYRRKKRPISAPSYILGSGSWNNVSEEFHRAPSITSSVSSYNRSSSNSATHTCCIQVAVNGSRERFVRVVAPNLPQLLMECTHKLQLPSFARKLFLSDGTLVTCVQQLYKDIEVFVSTGEPFKDIYSTLKERDKAQRSSYWSLNGVHVPSNGSPSNGNHPCSKRSSHLLDNTKKRRILVFKNGHSANGVEVVSNNLPDFLDNCTIRLGLSSGGRCLYNWNGQSVQDLEEVPSLPKILQPTSGVVLGPLWVTKGEVFSPKGAVDFIQLMVSNTKQRIQSSQESASELAKVLQNDCDRGYTNPEVEDELREEMELLEELKQVLPELTTILKTVKKQRTEELSMSSSAFKFQNIAEIDSKSRLLGGPTGVHVTFYANGKKSDAPAEKMFVNIRELQKGAKTPAEVLERFFDLLNRNENIKRLFGFNIRGIFVRRAFLMNGEEIMDVESLTADVENVWLSQGEPFVPVKYNLVSINLEKVKIVDLWNRKRILQKDLWLGGDQGMTRASQWLAVESVPDECETENVNLKGDANSVAQAYDTRISESGGFLHHAKNTSLVLLAETSLHETGMEEEADVWRDAIQQWAVSQDGSITNKHFGHLCLGMCDTTIQMTDGDEVLDGAPVALFPRSLGNDQKWTFTNDGCIQSSENPGYYLTAVDGFTVERTRVTTETTEQNWDITNDNSHDVVVTDHETPPEYDDPQTKAEPDPLDTVADRYGGDVFDLVLLPRFPPKHTLAKKQRWAIKKSGFEGHTSSDLCFKWQQQNLSWPVDASGLFTPVEGMLIYNAPKLKWRTSNKDSEIFRVAKEAASSKRVQVLKNGEKDVNKAVYVVCPESKNNRATTHQVTKKERWEGVGGADFNQFLGKCTDVLNLPFAARRVFDEKGVEMTSLGVVERDQILYITCGEGWIDPSTTESDTKLRSMLNNLLSDVHKIRYFALLKQQQDLVICCDEQTIGRPVFLSKLPEENNNQEDKEEEVTQHYENQHENGVEPEVISREDFKSQEISSAASSFQRHYTTSRWEYREEFIHLTHDPNIVLGVRNDRVCVNQEIVTCRREFDNVAQRWMLEADGSISSKENPQLVLTINAPPISDVHNPENIYLHARVVLTNKKLLLNGNAHQLFAVDEESGCFHAFATDDINREMTAANKSGVCTYSIFGPNPVCQPGFIWRREDGEGATKKLMLCEGCGTVIRGGQKLQTVTDFQEFYCAMGEAKENKIKEVGAFQCLSNKIDLSPHQYCATLDFCEAKLLELRHTTTSIARASSSKLLLGNPGVRVLARRNGASGEGVLIISKSIKQLLEECTRKLNLSTSARRLYLMDGELITNFYQLLKPYYPQLGYVKHGVVAQNIEEGMEKLDVRVPVDVWVSIGEPYIPLHDAESLLHQQKFEHLEKSQTSKSLQIKKHSLRHARARRMTEVASERTIKPVLIKAWSEQATQQEQAIENSIDDLQQRLEDVKVHREDNQSDKYTPPRALKLHAFTNGEDPSKTCVVFGKTISQILDNATKKLNLPSCARRMFTEQGNEILDVEELERNQTVCFSSGEKFISSSARRKLIEMKANWSRDLRKSYQPEYSSEGKKTVVASAIKDGRRIRRPRSAYVTKSQEIIT